MRKLLLGLTTIALIATGCGRSTVAPGGGTEPGSGIPHPTGADQIILQISSGGGFVPLEYNLTQLPGWTLTGDGHLYTPGAMIEIYPPPAVPAFQVQTIDEAGIQAILKAADEAGLTTDHRYDNMLISDAPTTTFTLVSGDVEHTTSVYALGMGTSDQLKEPDKSAIAKLVAFQTKLTDLGSWLPKGSVGEQTMAEPKAMEVFVNADGPMADKTVPQQSVDWPLSTSLAQAGATDPNSGTGYGCIVVAGADLATLLEVANTTNTLAPWKSDGNEYGLLFRPLLPTETGCEN